jgi:uncharacterized protein YbbC (DUF1343 family)
VFQPTSGKWAGQSCSGFQIHVTDALHFRPYRTSLALLQATMHLFPDEFQLKQPPYEYEYERMPLDLILGDKEVRQSLAGGVSLLAMEESWENELAAFDTVRKNYFLY